MISFRAANSCPNEPPSQVSQYAVWSDRGVIFICFITLIALMFVTYKVYSLTKFSDPQFLCMLIFLQLSLFGQMLFNGYDIQFQKSNVCTADYYFCMTEVCTALSPICLCIALIFNVNKWIYYNLTMRVADKDGVTDDEAERRLDRSVLMLNICTGVSICVISGFIITYFSLACSQKYVKNFDFKDYQDQVLHPTVNMISALFIILAIIFFIAGIALLLQLRENSKDFYSEYACLLWVAIFVMTIPLTFRSILDAMTNIKSWNDVVHASDFSLTTYNTCFFFIATYIPIVCQTASLIFGLMRYKQSKVIKTSKKNIKKQFKESLILTETRKAESGATGQTADDVSESDSDSENGTYQSNVFMGYFDPPISDYRVMNRITSQFQGNTFEGNMPVQQMRTSGGFIIQHRSTAGTEMGSQRRGSNFSDNSDVGVISEAQTNRGELRDSFSNMQNRPRDNTENDLHSELRSRANSDF